MTAPRPVRELIAEARAASVARPVLLYAASCPKCRAIAAMLVALSLRRMKRIGLEPEQWHVLYDEEYPQSRGYPIVFDRGRALWGPRTFIVAPVIALTAALRALTGRAG